MKRTREEKAITLIALIITIVVLLILAVVAINAVTGDGIIQHAVNAKEGYEKAQEDEETQLQNYMSMLNTHIITYRIGDEVKIKVGEKEEVFYVIKDNYQTVTLLAKENINTESLEQDEDAGPVAFSSDNYWESSVTEYPYELKELNDDDIAIKAAYDYGIKVGGTGRLITKSEARTLASTNSAMIYGTETTNGFLNYWTATADGTEGLGIVKGDNQHLSGRYFYYNDICGVRPVVEILKSKIS